MPHNPRRYPANWKAISVQVCWVRAQGRCEGAGCAAVNGHPHPITGGTVVLAACHTCACDPLCGDMDHLRALCQRCHLELDSDDHVRATCATLRRQQLAAGQLDWIDDTTAWS